MTPAGQSSTDDDHALLVSFTIPRHRGGLMMWGFRENKLTETL